MGIALQLAYTRFGQSTRPPSWQGDYIYISYPSVPLTHGFPSSIAFFSLWQKLYDNVLLRHVYTVMHKILAQFPILENFYVGCTGKLYWELKSVPTTVGPKNSKSQNSVRMYTTPHPTAHIKHNNWIERHRRSIASSFCCPYHFCHHFVSICPFAFIPAPFESSGQDLFVAVWILW